MKEDRTPAPPLNAVMAFRGVWALSIIERSKDRDSHLTIRRATHYTCCLIGGSTPVWGVWTVKGSFLRFYGARVDIESDYPELVWVRKVATWTLSEIRNLSVEGKRAALEDRYHKPVPKPPARNLVPAVTAPEPEKVE